MKKCKQKIVPLINSTLINDTIQLKINFNTAVYVQDDVKIKLVKNIIERMDLTKINKIYSRLGRKSTVNPITMLEILVFCYSESIFSSRKIEKACKNDIRLWYLLDGQKAPDHTSINRFRQKITSLIPELLVQMISLLIEEGQIDLSSLYIDGTKIESNANRYTFVWRKSVEKNQEKLRIKVIKRLGLKNDLSPKDVLKALEIIFVQIERECKDIEFVHGKGKRKPQLQKDYEQIKEWKERLKSYENHLEIMGENRNSYSKTDHDATFMRMKEDHMRNGQLKPAYNVQLASASGFIVGVDISHHPSDMYTLKPFLEKLLEGYPEGLEKIVADAGYESEENYVYLDEHNLKSFIKPSNYEQSKTRKYKKEMKFKNSLKYIQEEDKYVTEDGKEFIRCNDQKRIKKSGYTSISKVYKCFNWNIDGQKTKGLYISEIFLKYREKSFKNITTKEGIEERVNRSIQAEGAFSRLKDGASYHRFHHTGKNNATSEMCLMAIALNFNLLASKLIKGNLNPIKYKVA